MRDFEKKILKTTTDLQKTINKWKKENKRIVFTNGCFDVLHLGHIKLLSESKKLGDYLIVGLNTDESIKKLKGIERPINNNYQRSVMLASFSFVDKIVFFNDKTPIILIEDICHDILSKGGDYNVKNIIGASKVLSYGGTIKVIPLIPNLSTTELIKKYKL